MLVACSVLENYVLTIDIGSNDDRIGFLCDASKSLYMVIDLIKPKGCM
jgi:hypothetical protein